MELKEYVDLQLAEALGADNRWYCSEYYGHAVTERETLLRYYIRHGGAADFARRWRLAEAERQWLHAVHGVSSHFGL